MHTIRKPRPRRFRCALALLTLALLFPSARSATGAPQPCRNPYCVGVWYFTAWNTEAPPDSAVAAKAVYGRVDPWVGVRDYATGKGATRISDPATGADVNFAGREPLLGFYDELSQSVVDTQIQEAASEGLGFFAFYWFLDPDTGREQRMENPIHRFFSSVNRDMMHFALSPMISKQGAKLSYASWSANTVPELVSYIASESYLRIDNRPIVFDWQLPFRSAEEHKAALTQLRQAIQARLGTEPLVLVVLSGDDDYDKFVRLRDAWGVDGATCFGIHISGAPEPYSEMVRQGIRQTSKQATTQQGRVDSGMIYVPCGSTGIDARPWFRVGGFPRYDRGPDVRPRTTTPTVQEFREHLANIRSFINRHRVRTLNMVTLYAWNEWGEAAASIEPSRVEGYTYADTVRQVFDLKPRASRP